jgi:hypothetical protein
VLHRDLYPAAKAHRGGCGIMPRFLTREKIKGK